jgi:hypothetical protein
MLPVWGVVIVSKVILCAERWSDPSLLNLPGKCNPPRSGSGSSPPTVE